jgi:tRNA(Ile)-lysidine synthase
MIEKKQQQFNLINTVRQTIVDCGMVAPGKGIVVAASGGPDSTALLHILNSIGKELDCWIVAAHIDHGLRVDAEQDCEFVKRLGQQLGIPVYFEKKDVIGLAGNWGMSIEEAGRSVRYRFLESVRQNVGAELIATGHHTDDEAETFFLRILRGSSLQGLGGIPAVSSKIIRPLIKVTRQDILNFLEKQKIPFRIDNSNLESKTDRNFIRNRVFPLISERFPSFTGPLLRTMDLIRLENEHLDDLAEKCFAEAVYYRGSEMLVDVFSLKQAGQAVSARTILKCIYEFAGSHIRLQRIHLKDFLRILDTRNPSSEITLPLGFKIRKEYDKIRIFKIAEKPDQPDYIFKVIGPGEIHVRSAGMSLHFRVKNFDFDDKFSWYSADTEYFDAEYADFPLEVRPFRPGERMRLWGGKGSKKIKDILIDEKIPRHVRKTLHVLAKNSEILWIPGIKRSCYGAVCRDTRKILEVKTFGRPILITRKNHK